MATSLEADRAAVAVGDHDRAVLRRPCISWPLGLHDEIALRPVQRAGRPVDVRAGDRLRDFVDADLPRGELRRIDVDADGELLRAEHVDLRDAADHRQALRQDRLGILVDLRRAAACRS